MGSGDPVLQHISHQLMCLDTLLASGSAQQRTLPQSSPPPEPEPEYDECPLNHVVEVDTADTGPCLSGTLHFAPTRWVFAGCRNCWLICAHCVSCRKGGGNVGYIQKNLEKGYLEYPGSACCTDDMFEIFIRFGRCVCCLLPLFVNR